MTKKHKIKIGQSLKEQRLKQNVSLRKMAQLMGVKSFCWINTVEHGGFLDSDVPKRYCEALGLKFYETYKFTIK